MSFDVTVRQEGNTNPTEFYHLRVKDQESTSFLKGIQKDMQSYLESLTQSLKNDQNSARLYLTLIFLLLVFNLFKPEATYSGLFLNFISLLIAIVSCLHPFGQDSKCNLFIAAYIVLALGNYCSPVSPSSPSYIFPMVSVAKAHLTPSQTFSFFNWIVLLIPNLLLDHSLDSLVFSSLTIYFALSNKSSQFSQRHSRNANRMESLKHKQDSEKNSDTPYMNIIQSINHSVNLLKDTKQSEEIVESTQCLLKVLRIMQKNPNIYSPTFEQITKNLDIEDKIFIEQNTFSHKIEVSSFSPATPAVSLPQDLTYGINELAGILKQIGREWNFNTIFVASCSGNKPLYTCGEYIFNYYDFNNIFKIPIEISRNFLEAVEKKYNPNPYHNSCHAADVMNSFLYLSSSFIPLIPSIELFACTVACLGHDIGHPGTNNRFIVQTKDELALHYNDLSVLENMHARDMFRIMGEVSCDILKEVGNYWAVRKVIIEMILSTDMAKHFDFVATCKASEKSIKLKMENFNDRLEVYKLCIKAADISHTAKILELHEKWCKLLMEEFFSQGDKEKKLNLPVSMYCDRNTTDVHKSQAGFLKNISLPMFVTLHEFIQWDEIELICLQQLRINISYWEKRKDNGRNSTTTYSSFENLRAGFRRTTIMPKKLA